MTRWFRANRGLLAFLVCLGFFRTAVADWNPIPSGSMRPTLLEGDVVLVNRLAFDLKVPLTEIALLRLGDPRHGDVVTFSSPRDGTRLIKRVIGLPGDQIELRNEVLYVNGVAADYLQEQSIRESLRAGLDVPGVRALERSAGRSHAVQFMPLVQAPRDFGPIRVPADSYFMLGDNRDNSGDSRVIGMVARHLLIGRAHHVLVSADIKGNWMPRMSRTVEAIL
jgi:signal peptidase I